jgi:hypothetical protein
VQPARDADAPTVAAADLDTLLLPDAQVADILSAPGMATRGTFTGIAQPDGDTFSDLGCAATMFNTMWTAYNGTGYSDAAARTLSEDGDQPAHAVNQAVVAFADSDAATRFVVRTTLGWDRCADVHLHITAPPPQPADDWFTLGFASTTGDIATVVNTSEGGEGYACARAITSRSNVVVDVYVCGNGITGTQSAGVVNAITRKMSR